MRPSIDEYMMNFARVAATRATCTAGASVGAVLVYNRQVIATGYNGVPRGFPHCMDIGCQRGHDNKHLYLLHAEENAICQAAKAGIAVEDSTIYCTHLPCSHCMGLIIQSGITEVVFGEEYGMNDTGKIAIDMALKANIKIRRL